MKIASLVTAVLSGFAPSVFADELNPAPGAGLPTVDYHYGMKIDVAKVLHRTDNSNKSGVVPVIVVYEDSLGEVHKLKFQEWGGRAQNG